MDTNHIAQVLQDKKLQKHLNTKINRQFKTCRYIGDIVISEDEYIILKAYLRSICRKYLNTSERYITSPIFAVALVQIGIHKYDGRFWPHVEREIGMELPGSYQKWIGRSFYKTLEKYNKYKVAENEMMNNILLHCFITNYYASDLFDFLFAYYQIDLERDLTSNSKEMRDYLMQSMASGENTARAYKIKKHTSDAVAFNTRGCKIRVGKILRFMDNALFYGLFPRTSQNRIAQLFCKWADESKKFNQAKKAIAGLTKRGEKRYSSPYLRYNGNQNRFELVLPPQYIHLATNEELPNLHWKIVFSNVEKTLEAESENCVTGCKTRIVSDIYIPSDNRMVLNSAFHSPAANTELNTLKRTRKMILVQPIIGYLTLKIVVFDNTPGGAGHAKRLDNEIALYNILTHTLKMMKCCVCGGEVGDSSCYSCLRSYKNQKYHDLLKRKYVIEFVEQILDERM